MRKHKCAKPENHERYLITYADLITLLLVFFIVLYAGSQEDSKKFAILAEGLRSAFNNVSDSGGGGNSPVFTGSGAVNAGGLSPAQDFQSIEAIIQRVAQERGLMDRINLRMEPDRIVIGLNNDLLFASGSALLRPSAGPVLDAVAEALRGRPNEIRIEGHTDNVPISTIEFNSNWELSSARATAVLRRLVDEGRLTPDKLFAAAYGDTRPRADNATAEGRAANRRAEIVILYPQAAQPAATPGAPLPGRAPSPAPKKGTGH
jgi:chemotaxis protein MotB